MALVASAPPRRANSRWCSYDEHAATPATIEVQPPHPHVHNPGTRPGRRLDTLRGQEGRPTSGIADLSPATPHRGGRGSDACRSTVSPTAAGVSRATPTTAWVTTAADHDHLPRSNKLVSLSVAHPLTQRGADHGIDPGAAPRRRGKPGRRRPESHTEIDKQAAHQVVVHRCCLRLGSGSTRPHIPRSARSSGRPARLTSWSQQSCPKESPSPATAIRALSTQG